MNLKYEAVKSAIESIKKSDTPSCSALFYLNDIPQKVLDKHRKIYANIPQSESPILAANHKILGSLGGYAWSGIVITDKKLYYKVLEDSFLTGLFAQSSKGEILLDDINHITLGGLGKCFGTAYVGHKLIINGDVVGLLRMGGSIEWNSVMIEHLSTIFEAITKSK